MLPTQERPKVDPYTVAVSPLQMFFDQTLLSVGTCFFWKSRDNIFLVTNWHNVSGINPATGKHLSATAAEPNLLKFDLWINKQLDQRGFASVPLEVEGVPMWLEHPVFGRSVDAVCVPLSPELHDHVFPINLLDSQPITTRISDDVFILGYPMGVGVERLPIWKRASVASEPDINVEGLPKMYLDTASASGMSGSPVIRRALQRRQRT